MVLLVKEHGSPHWGTFFELEILAGPDKKPIRILFSGTEHHLRFQDTHTKYVDPKEEEVEYVSWRSAVESKTYKG